MPRWYSNAHMNERRPRDASLWREDLYYHETQKYTGTRGVTETVPAGYIMAQGRMGSEGFRARTGYLTGVRVEGTKVESWGWRSNRVVATTVQKQADPI